VYAAAAAAPAARVYNMVTATEKEKSMYEYTSSSSLKKIL
jgi:hypothetical protein